MMTYAIIIGTVIVSIMAFSNTELFNKWKFNAYMIYHRKQWYRMLTHGFLHADWLHLLVNMFVLLSFGSAVESYFKAFERAGMIKSAYFYYALLYFGGIIFASVTTLKKNINNHYYNSVGASGAVSAVVFTSIFFSPWSQVCLYGFICFPGIIMGVLYLVYSWYMGKKQRDNVNHDAHFVGAVYGFLFPLLIDYKLIFVFINQLLNRY